MNLAIIEREIKNGDVFCFRGRSLFGWLIKLRTRSVYSHIGIALWIKVDGHERLCCMEALEPGGVRLYPMDRYLQDCERNGIQVHWYSVADPVIDRDQVAGFVLRQWGKRYASPWQFLLSWGRVTRFVYRLFGWRRGDVDPDRFFCSELAAGAFRTAGYDPPGGDPIRPFEVDPGAVSRFTCLSHRGEITGG